MTDKRIRNLGICAHIDAGKTTLSERILFYCGRIHRIREVKDHRGGGATMDSTAVERRRGITVQSAATRVHWNDRAINLIDTPGHVDFTIEVERALSVLDGAILVLCATAGVQAQTRTVMRQMDRYDLPRIAFINKMDTVGADATAVIEQLRKRLGVRPVLLTLPIGQGSDFEGIVDVLRGEATYFEGEHGEALRVGPCPPKLLPQVEQARALVIETVAETDDQIAHRYLQEAALSVEEIEAAIRRATLARELIPVFCGSARRNKGVQPLLDGVVRYLPSPQEANHEAIEAETNKRVALIARNDLPLCALVFKTEEGRFGQLSHVRVFQGQLERGMTVMLGDARRKTRIGRLVRMHADAMEDIERAGAGDVVALFGLECPPETTITTQTSLRLRDMVVPDPVVSAAVRLDDATMRDRLSKALRRFEREDPSLQLRHNPESGETLLCGMGELHLEVYVERLREEHGVQVELGPPQVAYRESLTAAAGFDILHKKQDGGSGEYAGIVGEIRPRQQDGPYGFVDRTSGGAIPKEFVTACNRGFREAMERGVLIGAPVLGMDVVLLDGRTHTKDSSEWSFRTAARKAFKDAMRRAEPVILEPVMTVHVAGPTDHVGAMHGSLVRRRGQIANSEILGDTARIEARVPLAEMFGYSTDLRTLTKGEGHFSMEFETYATVPAMAQVELIERLGHRAQR